MQGRGRSPNHPDLGEERGSSKDFLGSTPTSIHERHDRVAELVLELHWRSGTYFLLEITGNYRNDWNSKLAEGEGGGNLCDGKEFPRMNYGKIIRVC